jgi:uncharacterized protein YciI
MKRNLFAAIAVVLGLLAVRAIPGDDEPQTKPARPPVYQVLRHEPGPKWVKDKPPMEQPGIDKHLEYLETLRDAGRIVLAGPFLDGSGGMAILEGADAAEAKKIADADPAVQAALLKCTVRPWLAALRKKS